MKKKIMISAGGTGGHLFPALALAHQLTDADVLFVGGGLASNRYFDRNAFSFEEVACGSFVSKKPWHLIKNSAYIAKGIIQSYRLLQKYRPDVVVGFGSFYGFPPLAAAATMGIPIVLFAADVIPGKVLRLIAPRAAVTGIHFDTTAEHINGKTSVVDMPLRPNLLADKISPEIARRHYGLDSNTTTLLCFGGSQGAQALNKAVENALPILKQQLSAPIQVIHLAGNEEAVAPLTAAYARHGIRCQVKPFEQRMGLAWSAADVVLCRSGAATLAEMQAFTVPGVMVPYPYAADGHQEHNADVIVAMGGGEKLLQSSLTPEILAASLSRLFDDRGEARSTMKAALLRQERRPRKMLADLVWETLNNAKSYE